MRFTGQWLMRIGLLVPAACGFGTGYLMIVVAVQRAFQHGDFPAYMLAMSIPFGLFGVGLGVFCLAAMVLSFTVYELDEDGIAARGWFGVTTMAWDTIALVRTPGTCGSDIELADRAGRSLTIRMGLLRDPDGAIAAFVNRRLADLIERQKQGFASEAKTYHADRGLGLALLPVALAFVAFTVYPFLDASMASGAVMLRVTFALIFGVAGIGLLALCLHAITLTVTVGSDELISRSLFMNRRIHLGRIDSVIERAMRTKGGVTYVTIVQGGGQTIRLTDRMRDYVQVRDYLRGRAGLEAIHRGEAALAQIEKRENRAALVFISIVSLLGLGGFGLYLRSDALARLATYHRLDAGGLRTVGRVTGWHATRGKTTQYFIYFEFEANGLTYDRSSPVSRSSYYSTQRGMPASVIYLPDDPETSMAAQSIGRERAQSAMAISYVVLAMAAGFPLLFLLALRGRGRRRAPTIS